MNYYICLELDQSASPEVIKAAYRVLANKYHPDKNQSPEAIIKMKQINVAYEVLSNVELKTEYDKSLQKENNTTSIKQENTSRQDVVVDIVRETVPVRPVSNRNKNTFFNLFLYIVLALFIFDYVFNFTNQNISQKIRK